MILQALKEYYDRKMHDRSIAQDGWIKGGIDFLLDIDLEGHIQGIEDLRELKGKKKISHPLDVPNIGKQALKHTNSGKDANLLWDNAAFIFGLGDKGNMRLQSMVDTIDKWLGDTNDIGVMAVRKFFVNGMENRSHFDLALKHSEYGHLLQEGNVKISFRIPKTNLTIVFHSSVVAEALKKVGSQGKEDDSSTIGTCLVTGEKDVAIEVTHPVTKGVWGAQSSGACIVSFNKEAFNSYGKTQSLNAPVGKVIASQYGKALNTLLNSSRQCIHIGDASIVSWSEKRSSFENDFSFLFEEPEKDDPDTGTYRVKALFEAVNTGAYCEDDGDIRFYILGLAPNAARISVRFWQVGTIMEFAVRIKQYFEDFSIIKPPGESEFYPIWTILKSIATQDESNNIPPNLAGDFIRAILAGTPYPATLLQAAIRRIRSDTKNRVKPIRAALIKAYLNRNYRFSSINSYKEVIMELDASQTSVGYQLGRLFATLEKIQEKANPRINATIRERFYGSASSTPKIVFPNLLRLKNHHLAKLDKGAVVYFEQLLGEIISKLGDFPAHLNLHEQGLFAIGYYHQRQALFPKKKVI